MTFSSLLIANRGEIAVRVAHACRELGIISVAVYSDEDRTSLHVRVADVAAPIGGGPLAGTYLNGAKLVEVAVAAGVEAVHPGYGFLSENAAFCRQVNSAGLAFVGPPAAAIEEMGDKTSARTVAERCGASPVPGTFAPVTGEREVREFAESVGYPIVIKAAFGGGGRGMRVVNRPGDAAAALETARREAKAAFAREEVYLEKYLTMPRHVEVQILADHFGTVLACGTRDCSVQRRHQKLVEEAPVRGIAEAVLDEMSEAAKRLARAVEYVGAGTLEFLVEDDRFYFLEMNTRIQVEHPVTEEVAGIDLVAEQIRVAAGHALDRTEEELRPRGHAIECRINAEELVDGELIPSPGRLEVLDVPYSPGVRWDAGYAAGDEISGSFDSLIGKLIVWGVDRRSAIERAKAALLATRIVGVGSTVAVHHRVLSHEDFVENRVFTRWFEERGIAELDLDVAAEPDGSADERAAAAGRSAAGGASPGEAIFADGRERGVELRIGARCVVVPPLVALHGRPAGAGWSANAAPTRPAGSRVARGPAVPGTSGTSGPGSARAGMHRSSRDSPEADGSATVACPMQGTVIAVEVAPGDRVHQSDVLVVVEAMKMENPVRAPRDGRVAILSVSVGDSVRRGDPIAVVE